MVRVYSTLSTRGMLSKLAPQILGRGGRDGRKGSTGGKGIRGTEGGGKGRERDKC